jgi:hypothetical protein
MFKRLEESWNARTPKILHNRTKENILFQLVLTVLFIGGMSVKDWWYWRKVKIQAQKNIASTD